MNITFYTNATGNWQIIGSNTSVGNGTYKQQSTDMNIYSTTYYWSVNVSDGNYWNIGL